MILHTGKNTKPLRYHFETQLAGVNLYSYSDKSTESKQVFDEVGIVADQILNHQDAEPRLAQPHNEQTESSSTLQNDLNVPQRMVF